MKWPLSKLAFERKVSCMMRTRHENTKSNAGEALSDKQDLDGWSDEEDCGDRALV
jgi:hypothetical protein